MLASLITFLLVVRKKIKACESNISSCSQDISSEDSLAHSLES